MDFIAALYTVFLGSTIYFTVIHWGKYIDDMLFVVYIITHLPVYTKKYLFKAYAYACVFKDTLRSSTTPSTTLEHKNEHTLEITYKHHDETYRIPVHIQKGPKKLLTAEADKVDVTDTLAEYLGPSEDFHGRVCTPSDFGWNELVLFLSNGDERVVANNEPISLK
jgi:hypothetical protein